MALTINGTDGIEINTDTGKLKVGTGDDLEIYHDGTNSHIDNNTGELRLNSASAIKLYHNDNILYYTESDRLRCGDSISLDFGNVSDLRIYHDGSHSYIKDTGTGELRLSTSQFTVQNAAGDETLLYAVENAGVGLKYNDSLKLTTASNGIECFDNVKCTGNRGTHYAFSAYSTTSSGTQYYMTFRRSDDTHDGYIVSSSDGALTLAQGSDYRLKENIVSMTNGIDIVKKLNPVTYKFKGKTDTLQGFIAHEVDDAGILNGVIGTKDAVDSDGNPVYQGLGIDKLIPALTAGLKEAITKIETLETKVAALEAA